MKTISIDLTERELERLIRWYNELDGDYYGAVGQEDEILNTKLCINIHNLRTREKISRTEMSGS